MKKRILTVMLAAMLSATLLAGCDKGTGTGDAADTKETEETKVSEEIKDSEKIKEPADSKSETVEEPKELTRLTSIVVAGLNTSWSPHVMYEARYDAHGNMTEECVWALAILEEIDFDSKFPKHFPFIDFYAEYVFTEIYLEYDENGNVIRYAFPDYYDPLDIDNYKQNLERWHAMEYDESGNLIKCVFTKSDGTIFYWYEWEYDSAGNPLRMTRRTEDKILEEQEYDSASNTTKKIQYDSLGNIKEQYEWEYDSANNKTKEICYGPDGSVIWRYEWEYDADGNETKRRNYNPDGSFTSYDSYKYEYEYDSAGNKIKEITYNENGRIDWIEEWTYKYDLSGNKIKKFFYDLDGNASHEYIYSYMTFSSSNE